MTRFSDQIQPLTPYLISVQDTANLLQVSERTCRRMLKRGELPAIQVGRQWRIDRNAVIVRLQVRNRQD